MTDKKFTIDVVSDVVCPWCFLDGSVWKARSRSILTST